jgi:hypothetical protein
MREYRRCAVVLDVRSGPRRKLARDGKRRVNSFSTTWTYSAGSWVGAASASELLHCAPAIPPKHAIETYLTLRRWRQPRQIALCGTAQGN